MLSQKYVNRNGTSFMFTATEDGHILWEGNFRWLKFGYANDYGPSHRSYCRNVKQIPLEEFKDLVFKFNEKTGEYVLPQIYRDMIKITDKISMVNPSGGPYLSEGMPLKIVNVLSKKVINYFEKIEGGYKIYLREPKEHEKQADL